MPLTDAEKQLAQTATYFGEFRGDVYQGWSPDGLIALQRGARPRLLPNQHGFTFVRCPTQAYNGPGRDAEIGQQAQYDVMGWLGYVTVGDYGRALRKHGAQIFAYSKERAE